MSKYQYEQASLLLPWYITGQLTVLEREQVESVLDQSPALRKELEQQQNMARMVRDDPEVLDIMQIRTQEQRLDSLLSRIDANEESIKKVAQQSEQQLKGWFSLPQRLIAGAWVRLDSFLQHLTPHWTRIAFSLFVVTQIAILGTVLNNNNDRQSSSDIEYTQASEERVYAPASQEVLIFQFSQHAKRSDIDSLFEQLGAEVTDHPEGSDIYTVALSGKHTRQEVDNLIQGLAKKTSMILFVDRGL